jgi:hypothetical protein
MTKQEILEMASIKLILLVTSPIRIVLYPIWTIVGLICGKYLSVKMNKTPNSLSRVEKDFIKWAEGTRNKTIFDVWRRYFRIIWIDWTYESLMNDWNSF